MPSSTPIVSCLLIRFWNFLNFKKHAFNLVKTSYPRNKVSANSITFVIIDDPFWYYFTTIVSSFSDTLSARIFRWSLMRYFWTCLPFSARNGSQQQPLWLHFRFKKCSRFPGKSNQSLSKAARGAISRSGRCMDRLSCILGTDFQLSGSIFTPVCLRFPFYNVQILQLTDLDIY